MRKRKHISWKTKCAAAVLELMQVRYGWESRWYSDAKEMTEDQFLSLFQWDHNILHETGFADVDKFWNLMPMPILAHRAKTKLDAKVIAKGRRIRAWNDPPAKLRERRKLKSRGFDKTRRRRMDGTVEKR